MFSFVWQCVLIGCFCIALWWNLAFLLHVMGNQKFNYFPCWKCVSQNIKIVPLKKICRLHEKSECCFHLLWKPLVTRMYPCHLFVCVRPRSVGLLKQNSRGGWSEFIKIRQPRTIIKNGNGRFPSMETESWKKFRSLFWKEINSDPCSEKKYH